MSALAAVQLEPRSAWPLRLLPPLPPGEDPKGTYNDGWHNLPEQPRWWVRTLDGEVVDAFAVEEAMLCGRTVEEEKRRRENA